ncbi:MAG: methylornithine synthase PylB [Candidatus Aminicenantes bacterium]|nr:methylornithine synthase PylB [Candidatus Aminicenantes bacterium]
MNIAEQGRRLENILEKARRYEALTEEDIVFILQLRQGDLIDKLFSAAREMRGIHFQDKIFLYGFLYISTYCRNNCTFCFYRTANNRSLRYRKEESEVVAAATALARSGVHLIDLTMGEDPELFNDREHGFDALIRLVRKITEVTRLPVMVSPGAVPGPVLESLAQAGAVWYACYQETHNPVLFERLRPGQDYQARFNAKLIAHAYGLLTEEGILVGVGETSADIAHSIEAMRTLGAEQVRAMKFVPREGTPMEGYPSPDPLAELLIIAVLRLVFPGRLIPATLDVEGLAGLERRLEAGANVVTSIVPPRQGLAGVAQSFLDIDDARRTVDSVLPVLEKCGLKPATVEEYQKFCGGPGAPRRGGPNN